MPTSRPLLFAIRVVFLLGLVVTALGLILNRTWDALPWVMAGQYASLAIVVAVGSYLLAHVAKIRQATACCFIWLAALVWFAGTFPILSTLLLATASLGLGSLLVDRSHAAFLPLRVIVGLALIAATVGWVLMFPIHYRLVYLCAIVLVVVARRRAILESLESLAGSWRGAISGAPASAWIAAMLLGLASTACWLPTFQFDDLAYHLNLPWQLQSLGYYRMDVASQVWALAPWSGDVLQAIAQIVAGQEARGALNALWLILSASLLWKLAEGAGLSLGLRWLAVGLYASHPLSSALLTSMQAETPATATLLALAVAIQNAPDKPAARNLIVIAALAGFLLALKISFALMLVPMGLWLLWRWKGRLPWRWLPIASGLALSICGASYAYAWYISGNPVLPLFNATFKSPYFDPISFNGAPWNTGFSLALPWNFVFHTSDYLEAKTGAVGFSLIALSGAFAVSLLQRQMRPLALAALACFLLPLTQLQYIRYAYPALPLLLPAMLAGTRLALNMRATWVICILLCALNLSYFANAKWSLATGALYLRVTEGEEAVLAKYAPERIVNRYLRDNSAPDFLAFYPRPSSVFAAELGGHSLVTNWYDRQLSHLRPMADADPTGEQWRRVFSLVGATHIVRRSSDWSPSLQAALDTSHARLEKTVGPVELWHLPPPVHPGNFMARRDIARRLWITNHGTDADATHGDPSTP